MWTHQSLSWFAWPNKRAEGRVVGGLGWARWACKGRRGEKETDLSDLSIHFLYLGEGGGEGGALCSGVTNERMKESSDAILTVGRQVEKKSVPLTYCAPEAFWKNAEADYANEAISRCAELDCRLLSVNVSLGYGLSPGRSSMVMLHNSSPAEVESNGDMGIMKTRFRDSIISCNRDCNY